MSELATAYVQLVPTATGMKDKIAKELGGEASAAGKSAGEAAGNTMGGALGSTLKKAVVALGIGKIIKDSLDAGGALQQSFGGLETIYGDAAKQAKVYAAEAVQAGISANDYAEQAVSFGASLKQAFGGDTKAAMESANTAIMDMADNSAKMGTDISAIQNAYQGFAKQNYTMLDNLKLGYGGTKTEMERLLADAEKLSGVKYDINNLGDVYDAIHVIQGELGLTGVAAAEASGTFTGSLASMKAAAQNLLGNLALGEDITPSLMALQKSVFSFLENNLFPMVGNIIEQAPYAMEAVINLGNMIIDSIANQAPESVNAGMGLIGGLIEGIFEQLPYVIESFANLGKAMIDALIAYDWIGGAREFVSTLADNFEIAGGEILGTDGAGLIRALVQGIISSTGELLSQANVILQEFSAAITSDLPTVLNAGIDILTEIINGILESLPQLIVSAGDILNTLLDAILTQLPVLLDAGINIIMSLVDGIINNLPQIAVAATQIMMNLQTTLIQHYPEILQKGFELLGKLAAGMLKAYPQVIKAMFEVLKQLVYEVKKVNWLELGVNIIKGIAKGIRSAAGEIWSALKSAISSSWNNAKDFLKIGSPSKLFEESIGEMIPQGMAIGIDKDSDYVTRAMQDLAADTVNVSKDLTYFNEPGSQAATSTNSVSINNNIVIEGADKDPRELAEEISYYLNADMERLAGAWA